jgi:dTDP-4-dehydrorhamnose reductase
MGVYGEEFQRKNFVYQVVEHLSRGKRLRVPFDQLGNATHAGDLSQAILDLLAQHQSGIWNIAGPDPLLSRRDFALRIAQHYRLDPTLFDFVDTASLHQPAPRPLQGGLIIDKARAAIHFNPSPWRPVPIQRTEPQ